MKNTIALFAAVFVVACASTAPDAPTSSGGGGGVARSAQSQAPVAVTDLAGTWAFDLDASDPAVRIRESCEKESAGDKAKATACYADVKNEASHEKIRFTKPENGRSVWTSFGQEGKKEDVWIEVPLDLSVEDGKRVVAKVAGKASGSHAEHFAKANMDVMRIEIVDARTIATTDPKKGRLVFVKE
jgi:hypothetical protein